MTINHKFDKKNGLANNHNIYGNPLTVPFM